MAEEGFEEEEMEIEKMIFVFLFHIENGIEIVCYGSIIIWRKLKVETREV